MDNFGIVSIIKISVNPTIILLFKKKRDIAVCTANGFFIVYNIKII